MSERHDAGPPADGRGEDGELRLGALRRWAVPGDDGTATATATSSSSSSARTPTLREAVLALLVEVLSRWPGLTATRVVAVAAYDHPNELSYVRSLLQDRAIDRWDDAHYDPSWRVRRQNARVAEEIAFMPPSHLVSAGAHTHAGVDMIGRPTRSPLSATFALNDGSCPLCEEVVAAGRARTSERDMVWLTRGASD